MEVLNIKNKKLFIDVLNNFHKINQYMIVNEGTNALSVRGFSLQGRQQAVVEFSDFCWNRSFQLNDISKLTNAMVALPESDVILNPNNIVVKKGATQYNILYSEYFKDIKKIKEHQLSIDVDKLCTKENLLYEFILTNDEIMTIRQSEKILNFKDKHVIIINNDGEFHSRCIEQDKLINYQNTFKLKPATIIYNDIPNIKEELIIELNDLVFLPKYDYKIKIYTYHMTSHGKTKRCFTMEASYEDDIMKLRYYTNVSSLFNKE